jgi:hypothetical protein
MQNNSEEVIDEVGKLQPTSGRAPREGKHAQTSAAAEDVLPQLKRVVHEAVGAPKRKSSLSARVQIRKECKPKGKRVILALPAYAHEQFGKIASPIFKTWASEQANPWDIPNEDIDLIMPLLWSKSTGRKWKSLNDVECQTAKNIVSGVVAAVLLSCSLRTSHCPAAASSHSDCLNGKAQ